MKVGLEGLRSLGLHDSPVELLVLSACRTAIGDREAELGFAGLAVQTGAKSALASLWYVNDEGSLALMTEFYKQLSHANIKAEALRQAQIAMIRGEVQIVGGVLRHSKLKLMKACLSRQNSPKSIISPSLIPTIGLPLP